jgi:hypothetical protein
MRINDVGALVMALGLGILIGVIGTAAMYPRTGDQQAEDSDVRAELKRVQEERDTLQAQVYDYQEAEQRRQQEFEQPTGDEPSGRPALPPSAVAAAAPPPKTTTAKEPEVAKPNATTAKEREVVKPPSEEGTEKTTPPPIRFGPPIPPRPLDDHAADTRQKTTP